MISISLRSSKELNIKYLFTFTILGITHNHITYSKCFLLQIMEHSFQLLISYLGQDAENSFEYDHILLLEPAKVFRFYYLFPVSSAAVT